MAQSSLCEIPNEGTKTQHQLARFLWSVARAERTLENDKRVLARPARSGQMHRRYRWTLYLHETTLANLRDLTIYREDLGIRTTTVYLDFLIELALPVRIPSQLYAAASRTKCHSYTGGSVTVLR